ncbi:MAG: hypothetical protein K2X29_12455, partial [Candidatus Obscuribacterales bacterium]|nr:hypothetical protein [Candidatus Obscuribacterales bacterium]
MSRAIVYIDGFNLYYRMLRNSPHKWLDISSYFGAAVAANNLILNHIYYFTANIKGGASDPGAPLRQMAYLRALSTLTNVTIIKGHFLRNKKYAPLVAGGWAHIWHTEEKGSDVNIA